MVSVQHTTIELHMHLGGLLSTQQAEVALGYRLVRLFQLCRQAGGYRRFSTMKIFYVIICDRNVL